MATFMENIKTIETAVYGKEMRPAIVEALMTARNQISDLTEQSKEILQRVDGLVDDGGGGDKPDSEQTSGSIISRASIAVNAVVSRTHAIGPATLI